MASIDEILTVAENPEHRRTATVKILLRQDLLARHADLERRLGEALVADDRLNRDPIAPDVAREIADLEAELDEERVPFTLRAVSRKQWADLMAAHPPTQQQRQVSPGLDHNPETFPIAAIAASSVEPEMTLDAARRLEGALNHSQFQLLWQATLDVNVGGTGLPKSRTAGLILQRSGGSGSTAAREESLAPSSSDE
jgi:hypothetical protein